MSSFLSFWSAFLSDTADFLLTEPISGIMGCMILFYITLCIKRLMMRG